MILVGTHAVVWLAFEQTRLSKNARIAIDDARRNGDGLAISDITLLELAALSGKGRIRLEISLETFLREVEARLHRPADQRPRMRACPRASSNLSQGSGASHHRSHRAHRGPASAHCGPSDSTVTGSSQHLVRRTPSNGGLLQRRQVRPSLPDCLRESRVFPQRTQRERRDRSRAIFVRSRP